jgi:hypothetical protein
MTAVAKSTPTLSKVNAQTQQPSSEATVIPSPLHDSSGQSSPSVFAPIGMAQRPCLVVNQNNQELVKLKSIMADTSTSFDYLVKMVRYPVSIS